MTKNRWKSKIKASCEELGTYRPSFDVVIEYTNKGGSTNHVQNPLLKLANELNRDALTYWKELGLTPAGLKRLNEKALDLKVSNKKSFADVLEGLGI